MADEKQLAILRQGVEAWNKWREENSSERINFNKADLAGEVLFRINLSGADLRKAVFRKAVLRGADLEKADLREADLVEADLSWTKLREADLQLAVLRGADLSLADLSGAKLGEASLNDAFLNAAKLCETDLSGTVLSRSDLSGANLDRANLQLAILYKANLRNAYLNGANLYRADLSRTDLEGTILTNAHLRYARLTNTNLMHADLTGAQVYGVSVWNAKLKGAVQNDIIITEDGEPRITVDNLEVAQFIHLLLNNNKIRDVIDTITSKVVLILGRFTNERKKILDAIREKLRTLDWVPVMFDFEKPGSKDLIETIRTLANMSRFIIADITDPSAVPLELENIGDVPTALLQAEGEKDWPMLDNIIKREWVIGKYRYERAEDAVNSLEHTIVPAALAKRDEIEETLRQKKRGQKLNGSKNDTH